MEHHSGHQPCRPNAVIFTLFLMKKTTACSLFTSILFGFAFAGSAQSISLVPLSSFGPHGDGSLRPGDRTYLTIGGTGAPNQRGLAYNPLTGHLLLVNKSVPEVRVLDALTGADIPDDVGAGTVSSLDRSFMLAGRGNANFQFNLVGVAEDGAIYVANLSNSDFPPQYVLYRWANETAPQTNVFPVLPLGTNGNDGDPSNGNPDPIHQRWGDTMSVRGSGMNTEILIASRGTLVAIFKPTDETMVSFVSVPLATDVPVGGLGYGLTFGPGNTFYGTAGASQTNALRLLSFDTTAGTASTLFNTVPTEFPPTLAPIGVHVGSNLLAGIDMRSGNDFIRLYDISNPSITPVFLDRESFVTGNNNGPFAGAIAFGAGNLYALDAENGIMAFALTNEATTLPPAFFLQPVSTNASVEANVTFTAAADGTAPLFYQWYFNGTAIPGANGPSLTIANLQDTNNGSYMLLVTNNYGSASSVVAFLNGSGVEYYEPFNYAIGSNIGGQGGWVINNGTGTPLIEAGNLTVSGLANSSGQRVTWGNAALNFRVPFPAVSNGVLYYSFILKIDDLGTSMTGAGNLAGFTTGTQTAYAPRVNFRPVTGSPNTFNLGTSKFNTGAQVWDTANFTTNDVVFVVGRYTFNSGSTNDDEVALWINPSSSTFGAPNAPPPTVVTVSGNDMTSLNRFNFRAGGATTAAAKHVADELRLGVTWALVTPPAPAVTSPGLTITRVGNSVTVSWPASFIGFVLEGSPSLPGITWTTIPHVTNEGNNEATLNASSGNQFLRLKK